MLMPETGRFLMKKYYAAELAKVKSMVEADAMNPVLHKDLGNLFYRMDSLSLAEDSYRTALRIKPDFFEAQYNLGNVYFKNKKHWKAIVAWMEALIINPKLESARFNIGFAYYNLEEFEDALMEFIRAAELNPESADTYFYQGMCHYELEQFVRACDCYSKAMELGADGDELHYNYGNALYSSEQYAEALKHYRKALELNPEEAHVARNNMADCLLQLGLHKEAMQEASQVVSEKPEYAQAYCTLGEIHVALGQRQEALNQFEAAMRLTKKSSRSKENPLYVYASEVAKSLQKQA